MRPRGGMSGVFRQSGEHGVLYRMFYPRYSRSFRSSFSETVQYARPEIIGLVLGAFIISVATKEYRSTAGSSPVVRFVLGMILAIGSLVFLGCPLRMIIRMSAGDLNAWVALIGFILGVGTGVIALKKGFSLGRAHLTNRMSGGVLPVLMLGILVLALRRHC